MTENQNVLTFSRHVARGMNNLAEFDWIKPVITADRILSFTRLDLGAWFSRQRGNGAQGN